MASSSRRRPRPRGTARPAPGGSDGVDAAPSTRGAEPREAAARRPAPGAGPPPRGRRAVARGGESSWKYGSTLGVQLATNRRSARGDRRHALAPGLERDRRAGARDRAAVVEQRKPGRRASAGRGRGPRSGTGSAPRRSRRRARAAPLHRHVGACRSAPSRPRRRRSRGSRTGSRARASA